MTVCVTDGDSLFAARYASDGDAPTLYYSEDVSDMAHLHLDIEERLGEAARMIVSEPIGRIAELWTPVEQSASIEVRGPKITLHPFRPSP